MKRHLLRHPVISGVAAILCVISLWALPGNSQSKHFLEKTKSGDPAQVGQWSAVQTLPYIPVHSIILPDGKLLFYSHFDDSMFPQIWDPATGTTTPAATISYDIFCGGHSVLPNGQVLATGGHIALLVGQPFASIYDPVANLWTSLPNMNAGRWYPTNTALPNGDVLVTGGDINNNPNTLPQVWDIPTQSWIDLTGAQLAVQLYPRIITAPNGQGFMAGPAQLTRYISTSGTGQWTNVGNMIATDRTYGSAVMYDYGKVLAVGGSDPPLASAETIDLTQATPIWTSTSPMNNARRNLNATILPDGKVLATGGSSGGGFDNPGGAVFPAEVWDPATGQWTIWASFTVYRGYHSSAVLLPDGRVFSGGGEYGGPTDEIFSPPYLFQGPQPAVSSNPASINYGQTFFVGTPDATNISQVNLIALGAATHAFNMGQRIAKLSFTQASGGLNVTAPADGNSAPPGFYMLFLVNSSDVPSVAPILQLGNAPAATAAPSSLNFGSLSVGNTSLPQTVTLSIPLAGNTTNLDISSISVTGDFAQTNTCGTGLLPGQNCTISVTFTPTVSGLRSGTLTITDNAAVTTQTVTLSGVGLAPLVTFNPTSLSFPNTVVNAISAPKTLTVTNTGTGILNFSSLFIGGTDRNDFTQSNTCFTGIGPGQGCTVTVNFTPQATGLRSATVQFTDNAPDSPQNVPLSGTGVASSIVLAPSSLSFAGQAAGTTSTPQVITITNNARQAIPFNSIQISGTNAGEFAQTNNCPPTLQVGASCTANVTFTPANYGTRTAVFKVFDGFAGSPQTASLTGTGLAAGVAFNPASLNFGNVNIGTLSVPMMATLTNTGTSNLTISSIQISSDFTQVNNCTSPILPGASCIFTVTYAPKVTGLETGTITLTDNTVEITDVLPLTGTGSTPGASLTPSALNFLITPLGQTTQAQTATLTDTGTGPLTITNIIVKGSNPGDYIQTNTCPGVLAPGASCTFSVSFAPTATGQRLAILTVSDNASPGVQTVSLRGTGTNVALVPSFLSFQYQLVGTTSTPFTVAFTNTGSTNITVNSALITGANSADFAQTNTCVGLVGPGATCNFQVTFTPMDAGVRTAKLSITDTGYGSPQTVSLTGTGSGVQLKPLVVSFPAQAVGTTSAPITVTLTNLASSSLTITSIAITGDDVPDFAESNTCPPVLASKASCTVSVTFTPQEYGSRTGALTFTDSDPSKIQLVTLAGTGK